MEGPSDDLKLDEHDLAAEAEQRFVDALLMETLGAEPAERHARIAALVRALPERRPRVLRLAWLGAAAALLLVAFALSWSLGGQREPLRAFVRKAQAEAKSAGDRSYELQVWVRERRTQRTRFYTRGSDRYVFEMPGLFGSSLHGMGPEGSWFVPALPMLPVRTSARRSGLQRLVEAQGIDLATIDARKLLAELDESWTLQSLPVPEGKGLLRLRADRDGPFGGKPQRIEIEAEAASGKIRVLRSYWRAPRTEDWIRRMQLELISEERLPENWFEHGAHHAEERSVRPMRDHRGRRR